MSLSESFEDASFGHQAPPQGWTTWQDFFHQRHKAARERILTAMPPLAPKALPGPIRAAITSRDYAEAHELLDAMDDLFAVAAIQYGRASVRTIQAIVARHFDVSLADLLSARRTKGVVLPRQIAMFLAKAMTAKSLPEIARRFGGRDHTTVLHAVRKIAAAIAGDRDFAEIVAFRLPQLLRQSPPPFYRA